MNEAPAPTAAQAPDPQRLSVIASRSSNWMRLLGALSILQGVLAILTVWGILFCWLPIWLGVLLFRASDDAQAAGAGDTWRLEKFLGRLDKYFLIQGIVALLILAAGAITLFAAGVALFSGFLGCLD